MAKDTVWKKETLIHLQEKNREFFKETEAFLADISTQDFSDKTLKLLEEGITKINMLPQTHPTSLRIKKQQEALFKHKNENEAFGRLPNSLSSNAIQMTLANLSNKKQNETLGDFPDSISNNAIQKTPTSNSIYSIPVSDSLIDFSQFLGSLIHLCEEPNRLKKDQEVLNEAITTLLREGDDYNEKDFNKEFCRILEQSNEKEKFFNNFKNYSAIAKETFTLVKECTLQSNELANKIEQALSALVSNEQWDNKAVKFFARDNVPDGIKKIRDILSNSALSHETKIIDITKIVKQKVEQPCCFRNKCVYQLYHQLNNVLKQHYPNLYTMDSEKQASTYFFYDKKSGDEKVCSLNTILSASIAAST